MNCPECQELVQRRLDGAELGANPALDQHLAECAACRELHQAVPLLVEGLRARRVGQPPINLTQRILAGVIGDQRRRRWQRRVWLAAGLAASILLMFLAGYLGLFNGSATPEKPGPLVKEEDSKKEKEISPPLGQSMDEARQAVADLTGKLAGKTKEHAQLLWTMANPVDLTPGMAPVPPIEESLEPTAQTLRQTTQGVSEGIQTVARTTRRAMRYFATLAPREMGTP